MKKLRFLIILILLSLTTILTSCTIVPHKFSWTINDVYKDIAYVNGNTIRTRLEHGIHSWNINGIHAQMTYIYFEEDSSLIFKPLEQNELKGTYKCKNNGITNTTIYITLENGDKIEALGAGGYYRDSLHFDYNGINYEFVSHKSDINGAYVDNQEKYNEQLQELGEEVRSWERFIPTSRIKKGNVIISEDYIKLVTDSEEIDLLAENIGVNAVKINVDNVAIILDAIEEGECCYYDNNYSVSRNNHIITLFYLEPIPKEPDVQTPPDEQTPPEEVKVGPFLEIIPELSYYISNQEDTLIKLSKIHSPVSNYKFDEILYVNDSDMISFWFNALLREDSILVESEQPPTNLDNFHVRWEIEISSKTEKNKKILAHFECDMFYYNSKWYSCSESPFWSSANAVACFNCNDGILTSKDNQEITYDVKELEFIRDRELDFNYADVLNPISLIGEIGEIIVYDATHFYYDSKYYIVTSEKNFSELF